MNRIIKFRCWVHAVNAMYWFDIMNGNRHGVGSGYISMTLIGEPITKGLHKDNMIPIDPTDNPIMQFTGLYEDGQEIYEGDILEYYHGYMTPVFFIDGSFMIFINDGQHIELSQTGGGYPVRGNIFENPEMLPPGMIERMNSLLSQIESED